MGLGLPCKSCAGCWLARSTVVLVCCANRHQVCKAHGVHCAQPLHLSPMSGLTNDEPTCFHAPCLHAGSLCRGCAAWRVQLPVQVTKAWGALVAEQQWGSLPVYALGMSLLSSHDSRLQSGSLRCDLASL